MKSIAAVFILFLILSFNISGKEMMMAPDRIVPFTDMEDARMQAESGPVVLFFFADWCPTCRLEMRDLESRVTELGNITVFIVDYDNSKKLKREYGVTYQHTFVQIDSRGKSLGLWNGGGLEGILNHIVRGEMN